MGSTTPDSTPHCNHQQLEIALRKPGFSVQLLQVKPSHEVPKVNGLRKMLFGLRWARTKV